MPLAYTIEDMHKAHYVLMNIESNEGVISELESLFKFNDSIMRHLIVKMKKAETGDSKLFELNNKKDDPKKVKERRVDEKKVENEESVTETKDAKDEVKVDEEINTETKLEASETEQEPENTEEEKVEEKTDEKKEG